MKLAICVPSGEMVYAKFNGDMMALCVETTLRRQQAGIEDLTIIPVQATYSPMTRELIAECAVKWGATHLFWVDADMRFPSDAALRLLKNKDKALIGANYPIRSAASTPTTFKKLGLPKLFLYTTPDSTGIEPVASIGFGLCLMRTDWLQRLPRPWFGKDVFESEDVVFCEKLAGIGGDVWVDHDLTQRCRHIALVEKGFGEDIYERN